MRIATIVGTRPELIRLSRVISCLDAHTDHLLIHTGQNYDRELNAVFIEELGIPAPGYQLDAAGSSPMETIGNTLHKVDVVLRRESPDAVLVLGDTNSALSVIAAKRLQIPIFHMEAGNRCFDERVPEETNRRIVDHVSDINLCYTEHARRYLLAEGLPADRVFVTGSPMREVLEYYGDQIKGSDVLSRLHLEPDGYFVASLHREENVDCSSRLRLLAETLKQVVDHFQMPVIFSVHPRTRQRLADNAIELDERIRVSKPLGLFDYVCLQMNARCTLSDSGTLTEESAILNFRAVAVREAHERPEGMDAGTLIMSGLNSSRCIEAINATLAADATTVVACPQDYEDSAVSRKILNVILSYTDYVKRRVWQNHA